MREVATDMQVEADEFLLQQIHHVIPTDGQQRVIDVIHYIKHL